MANLITELEKQKSTRLGEQEMFIESAKQLLAANEAQENNVLNDIGLNAHLIHAEKQQELNILNRKYENEYEEGKIYHYSELKAIGIKYRLFMKQASSYKGNIPADIGALLTRFVANHKIPNVKHDADRFVIIAPPKMFNRYKSFTDKLLEEVIDTTTDIKQYVKNMTDPDPALLYKIDSDHYVLLKQWGDDFSLIRRLKGLISNQVIFIKALVILSIPSIAVLDLVLYIKSYQWILSYDHTPKTDVALSTLFGVPFSLLFFIALGFFTVRVFYKTMVSSNFSKYFTKNNWH